MAYLSAFKFPFSKDVCDETTVSGFEIEDLVSLMLYAVVALNGAKTPS